MILSEAFGIADWAEAADAATALTIAATQRPDLLLLDMHMPGPVTAPVLCRQMRMVLPGVKIVIVTAFDRSDEIRACLTAGADGCLLKDTSEVDMAAALRTVLDRGSVLDPRIAFVLARELSGQPAPAGRPELSVREREVLNLLAEGCSNRVIARRLRLAEATVKGHVSKLLDKLGVSSRLEALVRASDAGLI